MRGKQRKRKGETNATACLLIKQSMHSGKISCQTKDEKEGGAPKKCRNSKDYANFLTWINEATTAM